MLPVSLPYKLAYTVPFLFLSCTLSAQLNPVDPSVTRLMLQLKGDELEETAVKSIFQQHNQMFASGDVYLYALVAAEDLENTQPALRRMAKVRIQLMENGIPDSSILFNLVNVKDGRNPLQLQRNTVLLCYQLPENYNKDFLPRSADALCNKDTTLRWMNGLMLQYALCDYMGIESMPVIEMNSSVLDKEMAGNNAALSGGTQQMLYRIRYTTNVPGICRDQLLFAVAPNTMIQQLMMEWYDDTLGRWIPETRIALQKNESGTFCKVIPTRQGLGRLSLRKSTGYSKLYIAAPEGMAFREAKLKNGNASVYKGVFLNGGTAVFFLLPEAYEQMEGSFTLVHYDGRILYAAPGKMEKLLGKKFSIPDKYRKPVLVDGQKISLPEDGFRFDGEMDGVRTVNVVND